MSCRGTAWSPLRSVQSLSKFFFITGSATTTAWYSHPYLLNLAAHVLHLDFKVRLQAYSFRNALRCSGLKGIPANLGKTVLGRKCNTAENNIDGQKGGLELTLRNFHAFCSGHNLGIATVLLISMQDSVTAFQTSFFSFLSLVFAIYSGNTMAFLYEVSINISDMSQLQSLTRRTFHVNLLSLLADKSRVNNYAFAETKSNGPEFVWGMHGTWGAARGVCEHTGAWCKGYSCTNQVFFVLSFSRATCIPDTLCQPHTPGIRVIITGIATATSSANECDSYRQWEQIW